MEVEEIVSVHDRMCHLCLTLSHRPPICLFSTIDEALAAKHMPDLGHEVKDFKVYTWRLNNWKKLEKKPTRLGFESGEHPW